MKKLLEEAEKNQELKEKIVELDKNPESTPKDYIQVAAEYGIELREEDFKPAQGELNDDELDAVAGGVSGCYSGAGFRGGSTECIVTGDGVRIRPENGICCCIFSGNSF